jgi:hypothetical protein
MLKIPERSAGQNAQKLPVKKNRATTTPKAARSIATVIKKYIL